MAGMIPPDYGTLRGFRGLGVTSCPQSFNINNLGVPSMGTGNTSILQTLANGADFIPGVGAIDAMTGGAFTTILSMFGQWFNLIGAGRREANIIVPVQNQLMAHLGTITNQILVGLSPDTGVLTQLYRDVWASGVGFQEFVLMCNFTDRRASGQALNTVMPYIDGSCGYQVPLGLQATPTQFNCISWGDGTIGGVGTNGMLGAIARALTAAGSTVPNLPDLHQSANMGIRPTQVTGGGITIPGLPPTIAGISTPLVLLGLVGAYLLLD
jgi:hypothetical protein